MKAEVSLAVHAGRAGLAGKAGLVGRLTFTSRACRAHPARLVPTVRTTN